jgi:NTE family protein
MRLTALIALLTATALAGCATRPVNPPLTLADPTTGYRLETRENKVFDDQNIVILAFSGGGTRAAAFSYGVLEFLARTEVKGPRGAPVRLLDEVAVITGVSGGSFTALAYGLYGDKLFTEYETRFLKRNVQGEITKRTLNPLNWPRLWSTGYGRSELASELYDEILFNNATFGDLQRGLGDRHLLGLALHLHPEHVRHHLLGPVGGAPVARGRRIVGRAGRADAGHAQQLRRLVPAHAAGVGHQVHRVR